MSSEQVDGMAALKAIHAATTEHREDGSHFVCYCGWVGIAYSDDPYDASKFSADEANKEHQKHQRDTMQHEAIAHLTALRDKEAELAQARERCEERLAAAQQMRDKISAHDSDVEQDFFAACGVPDCPTHAGKKCPAYAYNWIIKRITALTNGLHSETADANDLTARAERAEAALAAAREENAYPSLLPQFLQAMNDIGAYGHAKYGDDSFQHRVAFGVRDRWMSRVEAAEIGAHVGQHFQMYLNGIPHDHFNTRLHQLAAAAFNCMMEAYLGDAIAPPSVPAKESE